MKLQAWDPSRRSRRRVNSIASIIQHLVKREGKFRRQHSTGDFPPRGWTRGSVLPDYITERHVEPLGLLSRHANGGDLLRSDLVQCLDKRHALCHICLIVTPLPLPLILLQNIFGFCFLLICAVVSHAGPRLLDTEVTRHSFFSVE
jgi:hypothetical protein